MISTNYKWFEKFKEGRKDLNNDERLGHIGRVQQEY